MANFVYVPFLRWKKGEQDINDLRRSSGPLLWDG